MAIRKFGAIIFSLAVIQIRIRNVEANAGGPPDVGSVCSSMKPSHSSIDGQTSPVPFELNVPDPSVDVGSEVTLTLRATGSEDFKGFFVRAFESGTENAIGKFLVSTAE